MNNIKKYRLAAGMKQVELCKIVGITQGALSGWENGKYEPDLNSLKKMADLFHTSIDQLMGYTPDEEQKEKLSPEGESFEEDVIIVHRDGKAVVRKYTKEQLDAIEAILNQIGDSES